MPTTKPDGYLAIPTAGTGGPVLVLHAWWGLNDTIRSICDRLAEAGFTAFVPDLYHGRVADTIFPPPKKLFASLSTPTTFSAKAEIAEAAKFLVERAGQTDCGLAVIGFSLGAYYAVDLAAADPEHVRSVVLFYGTGEGDFSNSKADYVAHFGENGRV